MTRRFTVTGPQMPLDGYRRRTTTDTGGLSKATPENKTVANPFEGYAKEVFRGPGGNYFLALEGAETVVYQVGAGRSETGESRGEMTTGGDKGVPDRLDRFVGRLRTNATGDSAIPAPAHGSPAGTGALRPVGVSTRVMNQNHKRMFDRRDPPDAA